MSTSTDTSKLAFLPIEYPVLDAHYQNLKLMFWHHGELDFSHERNDWDSIDDPTRNFIKNILFLFAQLDGVVNDNLIDNFKRETSFLKDAKHFYAAQEMNEVVHNETYSILLETFIVDPVERSKGLDAIRHYPHIAKIAEWAFVYMNPNSSTLLERILAFICIEGIIFQNPFAGIAWVRRRWNKFQALCTSNEWIQRDEGIHTFFGMDLSFIIERDFTTLSPKLTSERAWQIVKEAVAVSEQFTITSMQCDLVGLPVNDLIGYTRSIADTLLFHRGFGKVYKSPNPLTWMVTLSIPGKTNFFESKVTEYSKSKDGTLNFDAKETIEF